MKAAAHLDFDVYEVTKHLGVHRLRCAGVSERTIATLAGWSAGQGLDKPLPPIDEWKAPPPGEPL